MSGSAAQAAGKAVARKAVEAATGRSAGGGAAGSGGSTGGGSAGGGGAGSLGGSAAIGSKVVDTLTTGSVTIDSVKAALKGVGSGSVADRLPDDDTVKGIGEVITLMKSLVAQLRAMPEVIKDLGDEELSDGLKVYGIAALARKHMRAAVKEPDERKDSATRITGTPARRIARIARLCNPIYKVTTSRDTTVLEKKAAVLAELATHKALDDGENVSAEPADFRLVLPHDERHASDGKATEPDAALTPDIDLRAHAVIFTNRRVLVLVRGSSTVKDWVTNFKGDDVDLVPQYTTGHADATDDIDGSAVRAHRGMLGSARVVLSTLKTELRRHRGVVTEVFAAGHSLGAAVASLVTMLVLQEINRPERAAEWTELCGGTEPSALKVSGIGIATPACMSAEASEVLAPAGRPPCFESVVLRNDMVPRLQISSLRQLLAEIIHENMHDGGARMAGKAAGAAAGAAAGSVSGPGGAVLGSVAAPLVGGAVEVGSGSTGVTPASVAGAVGSGSGSGGGDDGGESTVPHVNNRMAIPGVVYHLRPGSRGHAKALAKVDVGSGSVSGAGAAAKAETLQLWLERAEALARVRLAPDMGHSHIGGNYMKALEALE